MKRTKKKIYQNQKMKRKLIFIFNQVVFLSLLM